MKKLVNTLITTIAIVFVLACGTTQQPFSNQVETVVAATVQQPFSNQVETVVAATMEWLSINASTDASANTPTNIATDMPTNTPTEPSTSTPSRTPTNTFTPTMASLVVFDIRKLPPPPTPTPKPCYDPPCEGSLPSGDYIYIEHVEMNLCNASTLCRSFYPDTPNFRWNFNPSSDICVLWIEGGHRAYDPELSIDIYQNNQLLAAKSLSVVGDRLCRVADIPITARGDYKTKLVFDEIEFDLLWSIK